MRQSLYSKLVLIMLLLIVSLMLVVGVFLVRSVEQFYTQQFYEQLQSVFDNPDLAADLREAAASDSPEHMAEILRTYSGQLGIDAGGRNYYILSQSGEYLIGSESGSLMPKTVTANVLTAMNGQNGYLSDAGADYMDVALPVTEGAGYIVWIMDNKAAAGELSSELVNIILAALGVGLIISVLLSLILTRALVTPITSLTRAAERVAGGDFDAKLESGARDEIGTLTRTFNDMAGQLENTVDTLRRSETMRREFVANVSHELRTPITSIRSYAETLSENMGMVPPETEREFLGVIVNESDRMTKIVQDLLTLSRFDAGSIEFKFEDFSFEKSVRDVYNAMLLEAQRRHHDFTLDFKSDPGVIRGDRARIEQVIMNFVSNAIKYTSNGGRIQITAGKTDDVVWVSVRDNGIGIPKEDVDRVFERFYRVDKARSRESGGTGLGLSIASEIVARHNGKISLQSRLGKGTTITMTLPVGGGANG
ncbi:MAG: sensor histidine kinase [Candidatus Heteroscillospira sp.]|jgi:signal transduction histidine kinase